MDGWTWYLLKGLMEVLMSFNVHCFRATNLCSCHHPVSECQARVAPTVRKCSGATFLLLLRSSINNLAICTVNPSKDYKNPNSSASL